MADGVTFTVDIMVLVYLLVLLIKNVRLAVIVCRGRVVAVSNVMTSVEFTVSGYVMSTNFVVTGELTIRVDIMVFVYWLVILIDWVRFSVTVRCGRVVVVNNVMTSVDSADGV